MPKEDHLPDSETILQYLLRTGFVFDVANQKEFPLSIHRSIGPSESVNLLPTLSKIYKLCQRTKSRKTAVLVSELTSLLVAAELGLGKQFLIELEIQKTMPRILHDLRQDLKLASSNPGENSREC